jgi:hypothetical protein
LGAGSLAVDSAVSLFDHVVDAFCPADACFMRTVVDLEVEGDFGEALALSATI